MTCHRCGWWSCFTIIFLSHTHTHTMLLHLWQPLAPCGFRKKERKALHWADLRWYNVYYSFLAFVCWRESVRMCREWTRGVCVSPFSCGYFYSDSCDFFPWQIIVLEQISKQTQFFLIASKNLYIPGSSPSSLRQHARSCDEIVSRKPNFTTFRPSP